MYCGSEQLLFRQARPGDAERLAEIDWGASVGNQSRSQAAPAGGRYRRVCESGSLTTGLILVAERAGQVCGFALYTLVLDEGSVNNIAVDPDCQGRGYGRELLRQILAVMQRAGAERCLLEVRASNDVALALYESEGFTLDGKRPGYYSTGSGAREDALLMSRRL